MADGKHESREIGPEALKAFVHPLRMEIYAALGRHGPATASGLGRRLGESSGQTSYHLRQLERHGFVEDDPGHTGGRERWWRAVGFSMTEPDLLLDPKTRGSARALLHQVVAERAAALTTWVNAVEPDDLAGYGQLLTSSSLMLSDAELEALGDSLRDAFDERLAPYRDRPESALPEGARRIRIHLDIFPLPRD